MAIRIARSEFEHLAPQQPGKLRTNHDSELCGGESQSLLIDRSEFGVSCHCFRCGGRGFYYLDRNYVPAAERHAGRNAGFVRDAGSGLVLPADLRPAEEASQEARAWLNKAGIWSPVIAERGLQWSNQEEALYIPVEQERSAFGPILVGYIKRSFSPKAYRVLRNAQEPLWGLYRGGVGSTLPGSHVCLVEDVLSALRVSEVGDALALCGTELHPEAASFLLTEGYTHATIFLDGDNPTVKMKTRKIANRLSWLETRIVETGHDPKHYPRESLEEMLQWS